MRAIESRLDGRTVATILDLGCGTGRFSEGLAAHFDAEVFGIDPSMKMLARARAKRRDDRVHYQRGLAEAIPLRARSIDTIFMSMSFHHFADPSGASRECRRVLRDGGSVFLRTGTRDRMTEYPYVPFFPTSLPILQEVLPACSTIRDVFEAAGLACVVAEVIPQTIAPDWDVYADKLATGTDSVLARLSPEDFEGGLAALRRHVAGKAAQPVVEPIDFFAFRSPGYSSDE
jgi:SAM-dependent methyltransferase